MYIIGTSMMRDWFENPRETTRETIEQGLISSETDIKTDIDEQNPQKMGEMRMKILPKKCYWLVVGIDSVMVHK